MDAKQITELKVKYAERLNIDAKRADKAERLVLNRSVKDIGNGYYKVDSESHPGKSHLVCLGETPRCGCPDYTERRVISCAHILAATIFANLPAEPQKDLWTIINELSAAQGLPALVVSGVN